MSSSASPQRSPGPATKYGVAIKNGFLLATDEVNAGGVNGNTLKLIIEDEQDKKEESE